MSEASFEASSSDVSSIVTDPTFAKGGDPLYSRLYMYLTDESLQVIGSVASSVFTHATYEAEYFDNIEGEAEIVVDTHEFIKYTDIAKGTADNLEVKFEGDDSRLAKRATITGDLEAQVRLPGSDSVLNGIFLNAPDMFEGDFYTGQSDTPADTVVITNAEVIENITKVVNAQDSRTTHPFVVRDGRLVIESDDGTGNRISGDLCEAEGPDVENYYHDEFAQIFGCLDDEVTISTRENEHIGVVVSDGNTTMRTALSCEINM